MDTQLIVTIICSCLASSGLWAVISKLIERKDARGKMIVGLGHDRIIWLGMKYIERGWISHTEYENLEKWLYEPYLAIGGNGSARRVMEEVRKLPIRTTKFPDGTEM